MSRGVALFLALLVVWAVVAEAGGPRLSLAEMTQTADLIFVGTVLESESRRTPMGKAIVTDVRFGEIEVIHSRFSAKRIGASTLTITSLGGECDGVTLRASGVPDFSIGRRYLLFILEDGNPYLSPVVGGAQGAYEVISNPMTGTQELCSLSGRSVVDVDREGYVVTSTETAMGVDVQRIGPRLFDQAPTTSDPRGSAVVSRVRAHHIGSPMSLEEFVERIHDSLHEVILEPRVRLGGSSISLGAQHGSGLHSGMPDELGLRSEVPKATDQGSMGIKSAVGEAPRSPGGTLGTCGWQDLPLVMEQVPRDWYEWNVNNYAMGVWNNFMPIYMYTASDGGVGPNGENEFCGWFDDDKMYDTYEVHWGAGWHAVCLLWFSSGACTEIEETDIVFNPAYTWTHNEHLAVYGENFCLYLRTLMHELGHSWGMQTGGPYVETYDYDQLTVMHSDYEHIVENGRGIHVADASLIRQLYDSQTYVPNIVDVGVESYYALNGLHNATTDATVYALGESIRFQDFMIENISNSAAYDVRLRFYLSTDTTITTSDYLVGTYWEFPMFPAESCCWYDIGSVVPDVPAGTYYVGMIVSVNGFSNDDFDGNNATYFYEPIIVRSCELWSDHIGYGLDFGTTNTDLSFQLWNRPYPTSCLNSYCVTVTDPLPSGLTVDILSSATSCDTLVTEIDVVEVSVDRSGLAPGTYYPTITVTPTYGDVLDVGVIVQVSQLWLSASSVVIGTGSGGSFQLENRGAGTLNYTISDDSAWMTVSPTSGSTYYSGGPDQITVNIDRAGLPSGRYFGEITVDPDYGPDQYVTVVMDVVLDPQLCTDLEGTEVILGTQSGFNFQVWNCGDGTLNYTISGDRSWLTAVPTTGTSTGESDVIMILVDRSGMLPGHYSGTVTLDPNYGPDKTVTVEMDVPPEEDPALCTTLGTSTVQLGTLHDGFDFTVWNCGGGIIWYYPTSGAAWMTVSPESGSSEGERDTITVAIDRSGLAPGHYSGTLTIYADTTTIVTIEMDVVPEPTPAAFRVSSDGTVYADATVHAAGFQTGAADIAEWVCTSEPVEPGDVLEHDPLHPGCYRRSSGLLSSLVAGVVSTEPGIVLGQALEKKALLALVGIVPVKVTDEGGPILLGDLLVTSSTPGHAMRWAGDEPCSCSLVGKALEPMTDDTGVILVLLTAH